MAANHIEINTKLLDKDKQSMTDQLSNIERDLKAMYDSVKEMDSMWEGNAKSAFDTQFNADYETMKDICKAVKEFISCMQYASTEYGNCENSVNDLINAIKI